MTSRRKTKKETAKLMAKLLALRTHCKVRHYSRAAKRYKAYLRQITPWLAWKQYAKERLDDWQRAIMSDSIRCCFDVPELKYSRERAISGTGYGWQNSDGKLHASCLGVIPARVYGPPILSSLANSGPIKSSAGIPLEPKKAFDLTNQFIKIIKKQAEDDQ